MFPNLDKVLFKPQIDYHNLQSKQQNLNTAGRQNEDINKEHRLILNTYYDKILFYSAGAFSFTLALIGLVVEDRTQALAKIGFYFPNVYWLYLSWTFFISAGVLALLSRKLDAYYIANFGMTHYTEAYKEYIEEETAFVQKNPNQLLMSQTFEEYKKVGENNLKKLMEANKLNKNKESFFYKSMRLTSVGSEISVVVGIALLFFFGVQITQSIVWP